MKIYIKNIPLLCLLFFVTVFVGCSDEENDGIDPLSPEQGEVIFKFVRNKVYTISTLEEMVRLKVTLEKDGEKLTLPTVDLTGNVDSLTSNTVRLANGEYKVVKYVAYNNKGAQVQEAYLEEDNVLTVEHGIMQTFYFPVSIRVIYVNNALRNMLFGVCTEVLGSDSTKWPKTWRLENEDLLTWENLEFEVDDYGQITRLADIVFDGKTFPGMKKLPAAISLFATLDGIQIVDIPEFEELPDNMNKSTIQSILIKNTSFKAFPENFEKMKRLSSLAVINSKLTELPARLGELSELHDVELSGNEINEFPAEVAKNWQKVRALRMNRTKLTSLPANIFEMKLVSSFDFSDNPELSSLPAGRGEKTYMGGLFLDNCAFTAIPEIATTRMRTLSMANNKITFISAEVLNNLSNQLLILKLDGNKLREFPVMESASLTELSLNGCGLTEVPDVSQLPSLCSLLLNGNSISEVRDEAFEGAEKLAILDLSKNENLRTFSDNAGFTMTGQTLEYRSKKRVDGKIVEYGDQKTDEAKKPFYLNCVNVDDCPNLTWEVPAAWCCIKNFEMINKEELKLPVRNVVVYNRGSEGVTRHECPVCKIDDEKRVYTFPKTLQEIIDEYNNAHKDK